MFLIPRNLPRVFAAVGLSVAILHPVQSFAQSQPTGVAPQPAAASGFDAPATAPPSAPTVEVFVAGGTSVPVSLAEPLSSNRAKQGDN